MPLLAFWGKLSCCWATLFLQAAGCSQGWCLEIVGEHLDHMQFGPACSQYWPAQHELMHVDGGCKGNMLMCYSCVLPFFCVLLLPAGMMP
jgi:hypothetical protein